jgi:hypothetical protein
VLTSASQVRGSRRRCLLDRLTVTPRGAYSVWRQLRGSATRAFRVRRSSDNAELDIGFRFQMVNFNALMTHVGAGSGFIVTWYDQGPNGNDLTMATTANQPRIVNAGVMDLGITFDGINDRVERADALGLSGNPEVQCAWVSATSASPPVAIGASWHIGGNTLAVDSGWNASNNSATVCGLGKGGAAFRNFTQTTAPNVRIGQIAFRSATGRPDEFTLEHDGVGLAQQAINAPADTTGLTNTITHVGINHANSDPWAGHFTFIAWFSPVALTSNLDILREELQRHKTL